MATTTEPTKQDRWDDAVEDARNAVQILIDMQDDCQSRYDDLSEKQQEGEKGEALQRITDLDLQGIMDLLDEAGSAELPLP